MLFGVQCCLIWVGCVECARWLQIMSLRLVDDVPATEKKKIRQRNREKKIKLALHFVALNGVVKKTTAATGGFALVKRIPHVGRRPAVLRPAQRLVH